LTVTSLKLEEAVGIVGGVDGVGKVADKVEGFNGLVERERRSGHM